MRKFFFLAKYAEFAKKGIREIVGTEHRSVLPEKPFRRFFPNPDPQHEFFRSCFTVVFSTNGVLTRNQSSPVIYESAYVKRQRTR